MILLIIVTVLVGMAYSRMAVRYEKNGVTAWLLGSAVFFGSILLFRYLFVLMLMKENNTIESGAVTFAGILSLATTSVISGVFYMQLRNYWQSKLPLGKKKPK